MNWIKILDREKVREQLPKEKPFLCLWKGVISLCEYDEEEDSFYLCFYPAQYENIIKLIQERERKITHFAILDLPEGY